MFTGEDIRKKREKLDLSVKELADLLSVKVDNLYKWEKGTKPSDPEDFIKIESWLKGKPLESIPNNGVENVPKENFPALSPPVPDTPLPGAATLQDLIAAKDELIRKAEDYAAKMEEHYKDLLARLKKEQENVSQAHEIIRTNLVNLSQGQQELKEQMLVQTTSLSQQMNTLYVDLKQSVKAPPAPLSKGGKGLGVRTKNTDGKGKNC